MKRFVITAGILCLCWSVVAEAAVRENLSLDGTWSFATDPDRVGVVQQWFLSGKQLPTMPLEGYAPEANGTIQVPGIWDYQGYGTETEMLKHCFVGQGWYKRTVTIPSEWQGKKIHIVLGGISRYAKIWINGKSAGAEAIGCIGPHERDITELVQYGSENDITICVDCDQHWEIDSLSGAWIGNDYVDLKSGGLWGHVTLEARPVTHLESIYLRGNIHEKTCTAETTVLSDVQPNENLMIQMTVFDKEGKQVSENRKENISISEKSTVSTVIPDAKLWSPDSPYLYRIVVTLLQDEKPIDRLESTFGLRELKYDGDKIMLNGERIFLAGYGDDHTYMDKIAMPCDKNLHLERLKVIKSFGFNHVRLHSGMMPDEYYQACDEVGIMPSCEFLLGYERFAPGDSGLAQFLPEGTDLLGGMPVYLDRFTAAVKQYRNHPCLTWWVAGNELYAKERPFAEPFRKIVEQYDPDRAFVLSDGCGFNGQDIYQPVRSVQFPEWGDLFQMPWKYEVPDWNTVPILIHEMGNYISFPKLDQVELFDEAAYKPSWFTKGVERYKNNRLYEETDKWVSSTEKQYLFTHKQNVETARTSERISGYHWWLIQDYPTTSNGILDLFFREKSYRPEDILPFNSSVVLLLTNRKYNPCKYSYRGGEEYKAEFMVSNFSREDLVGQLNIKFSLDGKEFKTVTQNNVSAQRGHLTNGGDIAIICPDMTEPAKMEIEAVYTCGKKTFHNSWSTWVYPKSVEQPETDQKIYAESSLTFLPAQWSFENLPTSDDLPTNAVYLVSFLDSRLIKALEGGAHILLFGDINTMPNRPITWQSSWWKAGDDIVMGPYVCGNHAGTYVYPNTITNNMVRDNWCDISWYELINGSYKDLFPVSLLRPEILIRTVSSIVQPEDSSLLYQIGVGKGKMIVSKLNHFQATGLGPNDWLCKKLIEQASSATQPKVTWKADILGKIFVPKGITVGFKEIVSSPEPRVVSWSYRGNKDVTYFVRQNVKGEKLVWETQPVTESAGETRTFIFAGALGFHDEPVTEGFLLALNEQPVIRFDLPVDNKSQSWKNEDGTCELKFEIKRTIGDETTGDHYGEFQLTVPADRVLSGQPQKLSVESLGEKSRRWFGINPFTYFNCTFPGLNKSEEND